MITERVTPAKAQALLGWKDFADDRLFITLRRLQQLNTYATQNRIERDQLAVPISDFRTWGHSDTELRVLVIEGVVSHLRETSNISSDQRIFEKGGRYSLGDASCFILAKNLQTLLTKGSTLVPAVDPILPGIDQPHWDLKLRRLMYQGKLVKHFRCPAQNQETILSAFQEEDWPQRISDPIPPSKETESKQRLHDAIRSLNRNQTNSLVKFRGDGTGEGILWSPATVLPTLPSKRR